MKKKIYFIQTGCVFNNELMAYQNAVIKKPFSKGGVLEFGYDFYDYFKAIYANDYRALKKVDTKLNFNLVGVPQKFEDYAKKIVWYGRRGGQIIVSDISYME